MHIYADIERMAHQKSPVDLGPTRNEAIALRFQQLTEETTLHGLPQLKHDNSRLKKVCWILIMIVIGVIMCAHLSILITAFVNKEINVEIKITSARELDFPAVTLCNSNPIKKSALLALAHTDPLLQALVDLDDATNTAQTSRKKRSTGGNSSVDVTSDWLSTDIPSTIQPGMSAGSTTTKSTGSGTRVTAENEIDQSFQQEEQVTRLLASLTEEQKNSIGYRAEEMLFQCRYDGRHVNVTKNFKRFYNVFHGNCYTFNAGNVDLVTRTATRTGRRYGLELAININQGEFVSSANELAGALMLVHSADVMPFPEDDGIMLLPGIFSIVGLRLNKIERAKPPVGDCMKAHINTVDINVYEELFPVNYSKKACLKTCYQHHLISRCDCATPYFPREGKAFGDAHVSLCSTVVGSEEKTCMEQVNADFADSKLDCSCPSACAENIYLSSISTAQWPIVASTEEVMAELKYSYPHMFEGSLNSTDPDYNEKILTNNFLKVVVFYEDLNHEVVSEFRGYTEIKFLSDMGGTLGLWMGISIITILEFLEFAATVMVFSFTKNNKRPPPPQTTDSNYYADWRRKQAMQKVGAELYVPPEETNMNLPIKK